MSSSSNTTADLHVLLTPPSYYLSYPTILKLAIAAGAALVILLALRSETADPREPPMVKSKIPYVGHVIGLLRWQIPYFEMMSVKRPGPIITLQVFSTHVYVVSDPNLVQLVLRDTKSLSFDPLALEGTRRMFNLSEPVMKIIAHSAPKGEDTYLTDVYKAMHATLAPGPALSEMNVRALESLARLISDVGAVEERKNLYTWIRDSFTHASIEALYGPGNLISKDPSLIQSVWDFETDVNWILPQIFPKYIAPKAYKALGNIQAAFKEYYEAGLLKDAASLVKERARVGLKYGLTIQDLAYFEHAVLLASTTNTAPGAFWIICLVFASPSLLQSIRSEITNIITREADPDGKETITIDLSSFQKSCPLLISTFNETLRTINSGSSVRIVMEDMILDNTYFLRKGSIVQMPSGLLHQSTDAWGPTAQEFQPSRFISADTTTSSSNINTIARDQKKKQTKSYIPFGGGKHLCPGRHFATSEILGMVATLVLGFEFRMADDEQPTTTTATLRIPPQGVQKFATGVRKPSEDVPVFVRRREGFEGVAFRYCSGDGVVGGA